MLVSHILSSHEQIIARAKERMEMHAPNYSTQMAIPHGNKEYLFPAQVTSYKHPVSRALLQKQEWKSLCGE